MKFLFYHHKISPENQMGGDLLRGRGGQTVATMATFLPRLSSIVTGSSSDATVNFRITSFEPTVMRYLPSGEYARDVLPAVSRE
jgi:hypothetical protein